MRQFQDIRIQVAMVPAPVDEIEAADSLEEWTAALDQVMYLQTGGTTEPTVLGSIGFVRIHDLTFEDQLLNRLDAHSSELLYVGEQLVGASGEIDDDLRELRTSLIVIDAIRIRDPDRFRGLLHGVARIFNDSMIAIVPEDHAVAPRGIGVDEIRLRRIMSMCRRAGFAYQRGGLMLLPRPEQLTS